MHKYNLTSATGQGWRKDSIEGSIQMQDKAFIQKAQKLSHQLQHLQALFSDCSKRSEQSHHSLSQEIQDLNSQKQQLTTLEFLVTFSVAKQPSRLQCDQVLCDLQSSLADIMSIPQQLQIQKGEQYSKLAYHVGQQMQDLEHALKRQRDSRLKNKECILNMMEGIKRDVGKNLQEEVSARLKSQNEFTLVLEQACAKLESELFGQSENAHYST